MIFDLILVMMIIVALTRASAKGCTEDMHFAIGFLFVVRLSGAFYHLASKVFLKFTDSESLALLAGYVTVAIIVFFIFNAVAGHRIIDYGKKIPKTTGYIFTYFFAVIKTVMIFSIIFGLIYSHPSIKKAKNNSDPKTADDPKKHEKWIAPKSYGITYAFLGEGTGYLFQNIADYLTETVKTPVNFMARQKEKNLMGSEKTLEAVQANEELKNYIKEEPKTLVRKPLKKNEEKYEDTIK